MDSKKTKKYWVPFEWNASALIEAESEEHAFSLASSMPVSDLFESAFDNGAEEPRIDEDMIEEKTAGGTPMDKKRCEVCGRPMMNTGIHRGEECYRLGYERSHSRVEVLEKAANQVLALAESFSRAPPIAGLLKSNAVANLRAALKPEVHNTIAGGEK